MSRVTAQGGEMPGGDTIGAKGGSSQFSSGFWFSDSLTRLINQSKTEREQEDKYKKIFLF